jgi:type IV pilus assembly protein PilV
MQLRRSQSGTSLIEGLIAMVMFAFAVLGIVGLQANTMRHNQAAQVRAQASFHAEQLIGLALADPANAGCYAVGSGAGCASAAAAGMTRDWLQQVLRDLPGAAAVEPEGFYDAATNRFRLVLRWQREQEPAENNLVVETVVRP